MSSERAVLWRGDGFFPAWSFRLVMKTATPFTTSRSDVLCSDVTAGCVFLVGRGHATLIEQVALTTLEPAGLPASIAGFKRE